MSVVLEFAAGKAVDLALEKLRQAFSGRAKKLDARRAGRRELPFADFTGIPMTTGGVWPVSTASHGYFSAVSTGPRREALWSACLRLRPPGRLKAGKSHVTRGESARIAVKVNPLLPRAQSG